MSLIIDNVGFDQPAMAKLSEKEFIDLHMEDDAICRNQSKEEKTNWLKAAYAVIKPKVVSDPGGTSASKPDSKKPDSK